jgi:hypothetical protein
MMIAVAWCLFILFFFIRRFCVSFTLCSSNCSNCDWVYGVRERGNVGKKPPKGPRGEREREGAIFLKPIVVLGNWAEESLFYKESKKKKKKNKQNSRRPLFLLFSISSLLLDALI